MAGDDTTPDPLFKNVPRRPRSAAPTYAASWPRKEEPDGCITISVSNNNASPPAATSVASSKRPASSTGGGGAAEHVPWAKKHRLLVPVEEPEPKDAKDRRGVGILGGMPPALSHNDKAAAAAAAASSASSSEAAAVDWAWAENESCRKGKTLVVNEDDAACAAVARRPPAGSGLGRLLGDAIRSHGSTAAVAGSFKPPSKKPTKKKGRTKPKKKEKPTKKEKDSGAWFWCGVGRDGMSSAGSDADYSFDRIGIVSDRLRATLSGLGVAAPAPVRVYGRFLTRCDRDVQQTLLLMSSKRWRAEDAEFPLCAFLTEEEKEAAHGEGLPLTAYDRGGDAYELTFRFLECNVAYRLINNWSEFLRRNGLVVGKDEPAPVGDDVMLDLWLFRPPGGKVGVVMLHYRRGDAAHADAALDEVEQKRLQLMMPRDDDDAGTGGNAVMEDVEGDANEQGDEDAGVKVEVAAAAPAPSSPPSEPSGGGGAIEAAEEEAGALAEVGDAPPSTSSELHGGAGRSDEATAPLSLGGDGTGEEEEEEEAGGALVVMVLEVEAATQSSLDSNAGGAANEVAAPPSSPEQAGGGAAMMATEDEDEAAAEAKLIEAAARSWKVTKYEYHAAQGLMMLSKANG